jgi:glycosyltransferase involved in cell wall biosynthesis
MNSPKVSVIIPAYNAMTYLPVTIDNLVRQTFTDFEVLIVNDGSSDNIVEWFSQISDSPYKSKAHRRLRLISQSNQGISQTRNLGIMEAKGEYVAFLDADDLWHPSKLQKQVSCLDRYPEISLVHSWLLLIDKLGKSTGKVLKYNLSGWVEPQLLERNQIGSPSVMIRRRCFDSVGLFDPKLRAIEDWDMWIRMSRRYQFMAIAEPLTYREFGFKTPSF